MGLGWVVRGAREEAGSHSGVSVHCLRLAAQARWRTMLLASHD